MRLTESPRTLTTTIAVVDPCPADYAALLEEAEVRQVRLVFLSIGSKALRLARTELVDLWIVNVDLPDMSGLDLCTMLRSRAPKSPLHMVTDNYRTSDERAARIIGASIFTLKPIQPTWLDRCYPLPKLQRLLPEKAWTTSRTHQMPDAGCGAGSFSLESCFHPG